MAARKQKQRRMSAQVVEDEDYQLRYEVVAGIDVAKESAVVCVRMPPAEGRKHRTSHLQTVPATVPAITELAAELKAAGVQMVSMEATSDYWRVWFAVLEEAGLAVQLVNSSQARNLPGRPKTDKEDARWIARLTEMGMLRSSFVPPPEIRALRVYTRHIWDLTADRTRYWQRLEKLLEDALCKLTSVVSKLAGHQTARAVIEAMIAGERDPRALAALGQGKMRNESSPRSPRRCPGCGSAPSTRMPPHPCCAPSTFWRPSSGPARAGHRAPGRDPRVLGRGLQQRHRAAGRAGRRGCRAPGRGPAG